MFLCEYVMRIGDAINKWNVKVKKGTQDASYIIIEPSSKIDPALGERNGAASAVVATAGRRKISLKTFYFCLDIVVVGRPSFFHFLILVFFRLISAKLI